MYKIIITFASLVLMISSCDQETLDISNTDNPLEELDWLKEIKNTLEMRASFPGYEIVKYSYQGNDVFWVDDCYQCSDGRIEVYNYEGAVICEFGGIDGRNTCTDFDTAASDPVVLLDGINRTTTKGILTYTGSIAADGCGWLLETDTETFSLKDYSEETTTNEGPVMVEYQETNESLSCGLMPTLYEEIVALNISEIGELIINNEEYNNAPNDFVKINSLEIKENFLKINYGAGGCDGDSWELKLIDSEDILESNPVQRNLKFSLKNEELCQAYIIKEITFDISELQTSGNQVLLNITNTDDQILYEY